MTSSTLRWRGVSPSASGGPSGISRTAASSLTASASRWASCGAVRRAVGRWVHASRVEQLFQTPVRRIARSVWTSAAPGGRTRTGVRSNTRSTGRARAASGGRQAMPSQPPCAPATTPAARVARRPGVRAHGRRGRCRAARLLPACVAFAWSRSALARCTAPAQAGTGRRRAGDHVRTVQPGQTLWEIAEQVAPGDDPRDTVDRDPLASTASSTTAGPAPASASSSRPDARSLRHAGPDTPRQAAVIKAADLRRRVPADGPSVIVLRRRPLDSVGPEGSTVPLHLVVTPL